MTSGWNSQDAFYNPLNWMQGKDDSFWDDPSVAEYLDKKYRSEVPPGAQGYSNPYYIGGNVGNNYGNDSNVTYMPVIKGDVIYIIGFTQGVDVYLRAS